MVYKSGQIFLPFCHNPRVWRTDRRTDRQTDRILIARPRLHSMQRGKNVITPFEATRCTPATKVLATPINPNVIVGVVRLVQSHGFGSAQTEAAKIIPILPVRLAWNELASCLIYARTLLEYVIFILWVRPLTRCYGPWNSRKIRCSLSLFSVIKMLK